MAKEVVMGALVILYQLVRLVPIVTFLVLLGAVNPIFAAPGRCTLQVDGRMYLNGICNVENQPDGSFTVGMGESSRSKYFASVDIDKATGTARGTWNGKNAESHAADDLGTLTRRGACWVNAHAKVCAGAMQERPVSGADGFQCPQMVVLYAMTSRAQFQCGYRAYNPAWIERSRACSAEIGQERTNSSLQAGLKMFNDEVAKYGKPNACSSVITAFPDANGR